MIQSEPTEAMINAGIEAFDVEMRRPAGADTIVKAAYLAMKALDPDFATRTDTQDRAALRAKINDRFSKSLEYLSDSTTDDPEHVCGHGAWYDPVAKKWACNDCPPDAIDSQSTDAVEAIEALLLEFAKADCTKPYVTLRERAERIAALTSNPNGEA